MPDTVESRLESALREVVVPQTGRALGDEGTSVSVESHGQGFRVAVSCGFPLTDGGDALRAMLEERIAALDSGLDVGIDLSWQVSRHAVQPGVKALPRICNIIAVASGKGGVGKSTVTANVALALARAGARVGILDADVYGPSQPRILNLVGQRPDSADGKTMEPLMAHGVAVMSIGFLVEERQAVAWRGPMVTSALNQMLTQTNWGDLDYLFVDMPPGTGDIQLTLAQQVPVSGSVIVTTPQDVALADARKGLDLFRKVAIPVLGVVENMAIHVCSHCGHAESIFGEDGGSVLAGEYEVPLLGSLPLERQVREQADAGTPTVVAAPESPAAAAFGATALRIAGELAAMAKDYSHLFPNVTVEGRA